MVSEKNQNNNSVSDLMSKLMSTTLEYDLHMLLKKYSNDFNLFELNLLKIEFEKLQNQTIDLTKMIMYAEFSSWSIRLTDSLLQSIVSLFNVNNLSVSTKNNEDVYTILSELPSSNISGDFEIYFDIKKIYIDFYNMQAQRFLSLINKNISKVDLTGSHRTISFKNNFNPKNFSANEVYSYFHNALVINEKVIDEETLEYFLKAAFQLQTPLSEQDKLSIKITGYKKRNIIRVFYNFYIKSNKPYSGKPHYVRLLTDYFKGFKYENVYSNFSK